MDKSTIPSRFRQSLFLSSFIAFTIALAGNLFAQPSVIETDFEDVFGTDTTLSGPQGGSTVTIQISYSGDVLRSTIGQGDLVCVGMTGEAIGKTIPVTFDFAYRTFPGPLENGRYILGPFDASANGTYSLNIVADQVTTSGGSPQSVPEGEILLFTQDVRDPAPAVLDVRFDPPLTGEGVLEGPLGYERPKMIVDFNKDVAFPNGSGIEIVGVGSAEGKTITIITDFPITELEDRYTVEILMGPLDVANNGNYEVIVSENTIRGVGEVENYVPAGKIASFTQNITNPPPRILTELNGSPIEPLQPALDYEGYPVTIYFNYVVDPDEIDIKDIEVVRTSESNAGEKLLVLDVTTIPRLFQANDAYVVANYFVVREADPDDPFDNGELKEALNGDWEVRIVEGQILDRENPPNALPPQVYGTFSQEVVDPFRFIVEGRVYEDDRENPSLIDDGDPGLDVGVIVESFQGAGLSPGYQDISLFDTTRNSFPTCLVFPITNAVDGGGGSGSFTVFDEFGNQFQTGDTIEVIGSSGNDGTYTVANTTYDYSAKTSVLEVEEAVASGVADGSITKIFKAEVTIEGTTIPIAFLGTEAPTFKELIEKINSILGDAGAIRFAGFDQERLRIESATLGDSSSVLITEPDDRARLFSTVAKNTGAFYEPVPGGDGLLPGYQEILGFGSPTESTSLVLPIEIATAGGAMSGSFFLQDVTIETFQAGDTFSIIDSTGNNGTYTVTASRFQSSYTVLDVAEAVPSSVADGFITRTYTAEINVDGTPIPLSFDGTEVQTFESLLEKINTALGGAATATIWEDQNKLRVQSATQGDDSTVLISESEEGNGLFSSMRTVADWSFLAPVNGSDNESEGFHDVIFSNSVSNFEETGLVSFPVFTANSGAAMSGSFVVEGDKTQPIQWFNSESVPFAPGDVISIFGSTGNNGDYTVKAVSLVEGNTRVDVEEAVPSSVADGTITKTYVGEVIIDGVSIPLSIRGSDAPTFGDLINQLNEQLGGAGTAILNDGWDVMTIKSATDGVESSVFITKPGGRTDLFANLTYSTQNVVGIAETGSDGWQPGGQFGNGRNEYFVESEEDYGKLLFNVFEPGQYRLRATQGEIYNPETERFEQIDPFPEWIIQAVGDPSREGNPKDHLMYFNVGPDMSGEMTTINFSYVQENESPEAIEDDAEFDSKFQVLINSESVRLDVLANDTVNGEPAQPGELTIVGLGPDRGLNLGITTSRGSREFSVITTDGDYIYYTPYTGFRGWELFYYTIEDQNGNRDFVEVYVQVVFEIRNRFNANDDFFTITEQSGKIMLNVLSNDTVEPGTNKSQLRITAISPTTQGGKVTHSGQSVFYEKQGDYTGSDTFTYTMTDGASGFDTATVTVSERPLPFPTRNLALLRFILRLFGFGEGADLFALERNHRAELSFLVLDSGAQTQSEKSSDGSLTIQSSFARVAAGTPETQALYLELLSLLEPGLKALVAGQGDTVVASEELILKGRELIDTIMENASPELKADLGAFVEKHDNFEGLIGKTFSEGAADLGLPSGIPSIPLFSLERINGVMKLTTWDVLGQITKLWKSDDLEPESWQEVENAEVEVDGLIKTITDPDPSDDPSFYRLTNELEQQ